MLFGEKNWKYWILSRRNRFIPWWKKSLAGYNFQNRKWQNSYIRIQKMNSNQSFRVMEAFLENIKSESLREKLDNALRVSKPFRNFKYLIDNSDYRQNWFDFKFSSLKIYCGWKIKFQTKNGFKKQVLQPYFEKKNPHRVILL